MALRTLDLLEMIMAGHIVTFAELDALLMNRVREDLFLDYKHGDELKDRKKASATIRQYMTGFANSAGGILLIGVDQPSWSVTGCVAPGGGDLAEWAASCITQLIPFFSPPPRFQVIDHPKGKVLLVATSRSIGLIPCIESGERVYYFRLHDETLSNKTVRAPEYLITDLLLGRRERPYLYIAQLNFGAINRNPSRDYVATDMEFGLDFHLENQNISWAKDTILGVIAIAKPIAGGNSSIGNHLKSYIDIQGIQIDGVSGTYTLEHSHEKVLQIWPFEVNRFANFAIYGIPLFRRNIWYDYVWKAAAYTLSKSTQPQWYQIELVVNRELLTRIAQGDENKDYHKFLRIQPLTNQRPIVGWVNNAF